MSQMIDEHEEFYEQENKFRSLESAQAEIRFDWQKADSSLLLMTNNIASAHLRFALKRKILVVVQRNNKLREELWHADRAHDWVEACSLVRQILMKRDKMQAQTELYLAALASDDFEGARSEVDKLKNLQASQAHRFKSLELRADLLEAKLNNDQEKIASLSAILDAEGETLNQFFLESSEGAVSGEPTAAASSFPAQTEEESNHLIAESQNAASSGDWHQAKSLLASISNKRISSTYRRKLDLQREESIRAEDSLSREAKQAELEGDWNKAKSLLSRIKSDFGKFLLLALEYTQSRLSDDDEEHYLDVIRPLQKAFNDPWLKSVERSHLFYRAKVHGPPGRAVSMRGQGILWQKPDGFREVLAMIAENMRYVEEKQWYDLPQEVPCSNGSQRIQEEEKRSALTHKYYLKLARAELQQGFEKAKSLLRWIPTQTGETSDLKARAVKVFEEVLRAV